MRNRLLLHLGLHKTATTFLQNSVWPHWDAVGYAGRPTPKGFASSEKAVFAMDQPVLLLSNESSGGSLKSSYLKGMMWEGLREKKLTEMKEIYSGKYDVSVIIGLRKPEPWILSLYKHYLKYGGVETLDGFLGLEPETPPTLPHSDLLNMPKIRQIEEILGVRPFCFFMEEMKAHPDELSDAMAAFAGVSDGPRFTKDSRFNEGVDETEARICLSINRNLVNRGCLGKGYLRRNKTLAFDLARKIRSMRSREQPPVPLSVPEPTAEAIADLTAQDLKDTMHYIADMRGNVAIASKRWEEMLGEILYHTSHQGLS